ncbi:25164_t:CDS:2 [Racocetra persica]|uniref:25164_t:CDS:1 n=1 Tax=Racocetra persica TaxID=160502 RepID=A0ACA9LUK8_9GLOM|nr:25164_t:CDS:2 [Racocetra persica]
MYFHILIFQIRVTSENTKASESVIEPKTSKPSEPIKSNQREECLRKWATNNSEDLDVFVTITEKDVRLSQKY